MKKLLDNINTDSLIRQIVEVNNDFITRQNDRQEKVDQRYRDEKKEILLEIQKVSSELTGFRENFIMLNGEVSQIKDSILSRKELQKLTFECIEIFENKKIASDVKRQDEITQTIKLSKKIDTPVEAKVAFYKKPNITLSIAGGSAVIAYLVDVIVKYFKSTGR